MKKHLSLIAILLLCAASLFAQAPGKFSYQAVVRNASNALVTNAPVGVRVSILQGSATGNAVYVETHTASTNANGLLTIEIGGGTAQQGSFAGINWANGPFFLKTETDPAGGSNYTVTSTQQLMSVPYALYAEEAGNGFSGDYNDLTNRPTIPQNVTDLANDAGYVTMDSIPAQVNADWNATEGAAEILNKPVNANFGHGLVFTKVNNAAGATDITVGFTNYTLMTGGVVSLSFTNDVPAGATLNINNQGAKPIHYRGPALTAGVIKANDRCLFMYNATAGRYYLLANDRWGVDVDALATVAHTGSYNDLLDKPALFSGDYNDLTNAPTIPTVPTNVSAFVNDAGYLTSIPDSIGGIVNETDPVFTAWDKNYNDLTNKPELFSGNYNDLTNKPVNADFGHGIVRTNVNNASGATDINVTFTGYQLMNGGVVSLGFTRNVPAGATLNINGQGAKAIRWKGTALTDGIIKAGDRCLFMYNSGNNSYYLLANDRWGVDIDALATVAHTGSYNDLTDKPTIPTVPTNISAFVNDAGYITAIPDSFGGISIESDPIFSAWDKDYNDLTNKPNLAPVATSGDYNDLTNKPTIPTVPTNISAFVNDMGYITAIPDSFGGISIESDPIFSAWDKDYNDLTNRPELFSGNYNDLTNKPVNADFGHGIVRTNVNNAAGATDINVTFTGYQLMNGGVVSLGFTRNVPAGATLNINNQGAKAIRWKGVALTDGVIKAGDRCLFMYNSGNNSYYLLANDRWGVDIDALATVAHTGSYNDLTDKPNLAPVATSGNYNDLTNTPTIPTVPTNVSDFNNDAGYITSDDIPAQLNADWNATEGAAQILNKPELAPVATSGNYNDLTDKPTIPTVPTNVSAFVNDMGYLTSIPDSFGGISIESDPIFSAWDRNYNSLTNLPELFSGNYNDLTNKPELFSGNYNDLTNKPTNADFGHGIVRTNVNNASGATDISTSFTGYQAVNGGIVSLAFTRNVPAGATLNINGQGAKAIRWKGTALTDGIIKAGDRCLFMYNSGNNSYYLLANDRWGVDIDALATVAHTGSYNDLTDKPNLAPVATSGNYNDLTNTPTIPTVPTQVSAFDNDAGYITTDDIPAQQNADWNATEGTAQILNKPELAPVATSGNYNDLTGRPDLFSGDYNDLTNKPTNATFGQGLVRTKVNNASGATDIAVTFTGYQLETGGVVSLAFQRNVPAGATLNINNKGAKPIYYKDAALAAGVIKAGDRCLFMYNSGAGRYFLLANDRWGDDLEALATVAHTGSYNDLVDKPNLATVAHTGNYNDLTDKPEINNGTLTIQQNGETLGTFTANQSSNKTVDITTLTLADVEALVDSRLGEMQQQLDSLQEVVDALTGVAFKCGTSKMVDADGNEYETVQIGTQCWTKTNLRVAPAGATDASSSGASSNTEPYYYVNSAVNPAVYGYYYNWEAAKLACPTGWHLPSDAEWTTMEQTQTSMDVTGSGWRGDHAGKLAGEGWEPSTTAGAPGNASDPDHNASGFSAVPAGFCDGSSFNDVGSSAYFWSSTQNDSYSYDAWYRYLSYSNADVYRANASKYYGLSVRCLRDAEPGGGEEPTSFNCGTSKMVDADGNEYETVQIGTQCWTKTNLRVAPAGATDASSSGASSNTEPYYYVNSAVNPAVYGYYYNWEAAKLACPTGWHLPSDAEWTTMEQTQTSMDVTGSGWRGDHAGKLAGEGWNSSTTAGAPGNASDPDHNASGFSAVPAGYWYGGFYYAGDYASFWSSTEDGTDDAWDRFLGYNFAGVYRDNDVRSNGFSVRCLRDAEPGGGEEPTSFNCGTSKMVDADGNEYETVEIGTQCWTKTNLRVAPAGATDASSSGASSNTEPYYYVNSAVNPAVYGYYYNWEAAKLACPAGWHLPSDAEWMAMEQTQTSMDVTGTVWRGDHAGKLAGEGWNSSTTAGAPGNASDPDHNASGFSAVPAGYWGSGFYGAGLGADFWSSTESGTFNAWYRYLDYDYAGVNRYYYYRDYGFSVRCLRD